MCVDMSLRASDRLKSHSSGQFVVRTACLPRRTPLRFHSCQHLSWHGLLRSLRSWPLRLCKIAQFRDIENDGDAQALQGRRRAFARRWDGQGNSSIGLYAHTLPKKLHHLHTLGTRVSRYHRIGQYSQHVHTCERTYQRQNSAPAESTPHGAHRFDHDLKLGGHRFRSDAASGEISNSRPNPHGIAT